MKAKQKLEKIISDTSSFYVRSCGDNVAIFQGNANLIQKLESIGFARNFYFSKEEGQKYRTNQFCRSTENGSEFVFVSYGNEKEWTYAVETNGKITLAGTECFNNDIKYIFH